MRSTWDVANRLALSLVSVTAKLRSVSLVAQTDSAVRHQVIACLVSVESNLVSLLDEVRFGQSDQKSGSRRDRGRLWFRSFIGVTFSKARCVDFLGDPCKGNGHFLGSNTMMSAWN